jgi:hypothetical protein
MVSLGLGLLSDNWRVDFNLGQRYFKPWATRTPVLLLLLFVTFLLIGLAELACHAIPEHGGWGSHRHVTNKRNEVPPGKILQLAIVGETVLRVYYSRSVLQNI